MTEGEDAVAPSGDLVFYLILSLGVVASAVSTVGVAAGHEKKDRKKRARRDELNLCHVE